MISEFDAFGFPINFHYKKKGSVYKTGHTGFFSFIFKFYMLWTLYLEVSMMLEYKKDWIVKGDSVIDSHTLGTVSLERMNGLPFYTFEEVTEVRFNGYIMFPGYQEFFIPYFPRRINH